MRWTFATGKGNLSKTKKSPKNTRVPLQGNKKSHKLSNIFSIYFVDGGFYKTLTPSNAQLFYTALMMMYEILGKGRSRNLRTRTPAPLLLTQLDSSCVTEMLGFRHRRLVQTARREPLLMLLCAPSLNSSSSPNGLALPVIAAEYGG